MDQTKSEPAPFEKAAAKISDDFVAHYSDSKGNPNFANIFNALGSLAGFGCQMAIREAPRWPSDNPAPVATSKSRTSSSRRWVN